MARYVKELPLVDDFQNTYPQIARLLYNEKYQPCIRDGEQVFQKGDGFWVAQSFVKLERKGNIVRLEAWIDFYGADQGLEGVAGIAVKKPLRKLVAQIEEILTRPNENYVPDPEEDGDADVGFCNICGAKLAQEDKFCPACGVTVTSKLIADTPMDKNISKREYLKHHAGEAFYKNLTIVAIGDYILAGLYVLSSIVYPLAIVIALAQLGLTLGMHLGKSKGCAIGLAVCGVLWVIMMALNGMYSSWGTWLVGFYGLVIFINADKRYKALTRK